MRSTPKPEVSKQKRQDVVFCVQRAALRGSDAACVMAIFRAQ
jgi:hypothetical protein